MTDDLLQRFFAGECTQQENTEVRLWVEASAENRKHFHSERKLYNAVLLNADAAETNAVGQPHRFFHIIRYGIVAAVAAVVAVSATLLLTNGNFVSERTIANGGTTVNVPFGQNADITMPDGTKVCLAGGSEFRYGAFDGKSRRVFLDGEAYFEVAHDAGRPFTVKTTQAEVKVLGTKFDVKSFDSFEVALFDGKVEVAAGGRKTTLLPDNCARLDGGELLVERIADSEQYRWRDGILSFSDETLITLLPKLERFFGGEVTLSGDTAADRRISGKFRSRDGLYYALTILSNELGLTVEQDTSSQRYYIK